MVIRHNTAVSRWLTRVVEQQDPAVHMARAPCRHLPVRSGRAVPPSPPTKSCIRGELSADAIERAYVMGAD